MKNKDKFDAIVIGAGPSGIFASMKLSEAGLNVALIDKGGNFYSRQNEKNKGLIGFGGAAMRYDANLDYSNGIPETSNLGERVFGDRNTANLYIADVYNKLRFFGLPNIINKEKIGSGGSYDSGELEIVDRGILPIGEKQSRAILKKIYDYLMQQNFKFFEFSDVDSIVKQNGIFKVKFTDLKNKSRSMIMGKYVVLATGKLSVVKSRSLFDELGVKYEYCDAIDIGVRVETYKKVTDQITQDCVNPKIIFNQNGVSIRTFCWCPGGKVIDYNFEGMCIVDGQHCHDNPTKQTNFGIVATINLPSNVDGTDFGITNVGAFNKYSKYKPGLQILKDFINLKATSTAGLQKNDIKPTIDNFSLFDLNLLLSTNLRNSLLSIIEKINNVYPGAVPKNSLIYAPVLERIFPKVHLNSNMESSLSGFFIIGDISGKAIGVITGAAMGIKAASCIISQNDKSKR